MGLEGLPGKMKIQLKDSGYNGMFQAYPRQNFPSSLLPSQYKYDTVLSSPLLFSCLPGSMGKDVQFL